MNQSLISVIVPVYNVEDYLVQCLDSILSQTYKNIEVLVVNDGSTDRSGEICDAYAVKDSRIRVIHQENGGLSHARNVGIDLAKGDYLTFVDSDDGIHETFLEDLYDAIQRNQVPIAVGNYYRYNENNQLFYYHHDFSDGQEEVLTQEEYWYHFCTKDAIGVALVTAWGKLFHRELFHFIRFPVGQLIEDEATIHRLFLGTSHFVMVHKSSYLYRQRSNSIMTDVTLKQKRMQDVFLAYDRKITDLYFSGGDVAILVQNFIQILNMYKQELDQANLQDTTVYKDILYRLNLWEKQRSE